MAIDGVKIIDSDEAYDIYRFVIENFKDGKHIDEIIAAIRKEEKNYCVNAFYTEIYWTALAYSLWEIGHLPDEIKNKACEIMQKGANAFWLEIDEEALRERQKVLDRFAIQLRSKNPKPVRGTKAKTKQTPYFRKGDVLAVTFEGEYGIVFVSAVKESPGKTEYHLACTRSLQKTKPTLDDFLRSQTAYVRQNTSCWLKTDCWFQHKELGLLLDRLEKIGRVEWKDVMLGVLSPASTLEDIYAEITRDMEIRQLTLGDTRRLVKPSGNPAL